jgi:hypothetical protein
MKYAMFQIENIKAKILKVSSPQLSLQAIGHVEST